MNSNWDWLSSMKANRLLSIVENYSHTKEKYSIIKGTTKHCLNLKEFQIILFIQ